MCKFIKKCLFLIQLAAFKFANWVLKGQICQCIWLQVINDEIGNSNIFITLFSLKVDV